MIDREASSLQSEKKALFDLMLKEKGIVAPQETAIPRSANGGALPLSLAQERIWSLQQVDPESAAYHMRVARRIVGPLNMDLLTQVLETIASRHDILRTCFPTDAGRPAQMLIRDFTFPFTFLNMQDRPAAEKDTAAAQAMDHFVEQPFDLEHGPMARALLIRHSQIEHLLLLVFHQIVFDGTSSGIFIHEMTTLYDALAAGQEAELPPLPIQYADYSLWQRERLQEEMLAPQRDYWRSQMGQPYRPLALPTDGARAARETFTGDLIEFALPTELSQALKQFCQHEGVTLFAALLAAFNSLLHLYSGREDILVFTSTEGSVKPELKPLIGLFARQLPLRTDLSGRPTFSIVLKRVSQVIQDAFAHQDLSFSELVETIQLAPGHSPAALFQAMFIFLSEPRPSLALSGLQLEPIPAGNHIAKFDWRLYMVDRGDVLSGWLEYKLDLFSPETVARVLKHFQALITAAVQNPGQPIDALLSLPDTDYHQRQAEATQAPVQQGFAPPRDRIEMELKQIWEETFSISPLGIHDDFFALGGHSLLAVRLFALVEKHTRRRLPLTTLFSAPTIAQMAELLRDNEWERYQSSLIPIIPVGSRTPLFFVPPAGSTVLKYAGFAHLVGDGQPFYGLEYSGLEAGTKPQSTVEEIARDFLREIRTVQPSGPYMLCGQCFGGLVAFEMARQIYDQGNTVALLAILDTEIPPLARVSALEPGLRMEPSPVARLRELPLLPFTKARQIYVHFRKTYKRTLATRVWAHRSPLYLRENLAVWRRFSRTLKAHLDARLYYLVEETYPGQISLLQFSSSNHEQKEGRWLWADLACGGFDSAIIADDQVSRTRGDFARELGIWLQEQIEEAHASLAAGNKTPIASEGTD